MARDHCETAGKQPAAPNKPSTGSLSHMVTARICTTNALSLPLSPRVALSLAVSFFLSFCVVNLSLFLCHCLASSFLSTPGHTATPFLRWVHRVRSRLSMRPLPSSVSLWRCGGGRGLDKWDSAVLQLIIIPRLSLTDARDLSSATQTYISPLAAQCVHVWVCVFVCVYVCVWACMKDMHGILPYPALLRSRCLVYTAAGHWQAISDTLAQAHTHTPAIDECTHTHTYNIWFISGQDFLCSNLFHFISEPKH